MKQWLINLKNKYIIPEWYKAWKSLAVLLPAIAYLITTAMDVIQQTQGIGLIPPEYRQHFGFLYIGLGFVGRVINQGGILKGDKKDGG
ncbi:DUF7940 domain-containing protein [Acinetobacter sp. ANC 4640]